MGTSLIIIAIIIYFIHEQFEFSDVRRVNYLFLPAFSLFQFFNQMTWSFKNNLALLIICFFSLFVGYYQAKYSMVRIENKGKYYFKNQAGEEQPIYKKVVKARGGRTYLLGWLIILGVQIGIKLLLFREKITSGELYSEILGDIFRDLFAPYRLIDAKNGHTTWYVWALYGISSLCYTAFLAKMSPSFRKVIFSKEEPSDYVLEKAAHTDKKN